MTSILHRALGAADRIARNRRWRASLSTNSEIVAGGAADRSRFPVFRGAAFLTWPGRDFAGLVNAHSHLELTVMRGFLESEDTISLPGAKAYDRADGDDGRRSTGVGNLRRHRSGPRRAVTCFGDSSSAATHAMKALQEVGLRGIVYQESFGPDPNLAEENVARLREQIAELRDQENEWCAGRIAARALHS